jgi:hypothetical protein
MLNSASNIAITPTAKASFVTNSPFFGITPSSINYRSNSGVATTRNASITTVIRKKVSETLYGIANLAMRFKVPAFNF